jgi:hypothetical protein
MRNASSHLSLSKKKKGRLGVSIAHEVGSRNGPTVVGVQHKEPEGGNQGWTRALFSFQKKIIKKFRFSVTSNLTAHYKALNKNINNN